jgi:hypothetical protein
MSDDREELAGKEMAITVDAIARMQREGLTQEEIGHILLHKTDLAQDVADVFNRFFAGMTAEQDIELRRACFVETKESREADATLSKIATHLTSAIKPLETAQGQQLQSELESVIESRISEICLIVGSKGAGKSTFVSRFFEDVLPDDLEKSCVVVNLDVAQFTGDEQTIQRWLSEHLRDKLEDAIFQSQERAYEDYVGMFFRVYKRWSEGTHKHLYETDKTGFKIKFGEYVEQRREETPDEYLIGLMRHCVAGRKRLPCLVFDNTDQFSQRIQEVVFQYAFALSSGCPSFVIIPVTDRTIWRLSKAGALQSAPSRTFYLPPPAPSEVISRRIEYIQNKLEQEPPQAGQYFSSRGIRISIANLNAFVSVLEDAFVRNETLAGLIGRLDLSPFFHPAMGRVPG